MSVATTEDADATTPIAPGVVLIASPLTWIVFGLWGVGIALLAKSGAFHPPVGKPPILVLVAAVGPAILFLAAHGAIQPFRAFVARVDIAELVVLQAWRVVGLAFVFVWALGQLPGAFAFPAGYGDAAVGVVAIPAAILAARRSKGWRKSAWVVTIAGLVDFIVAFSTGILSREGAPLHFDGAPASTALGEFPMSMIPTFIVPAFFILHIMTIMKLRGQR